MTLAPTNSLRCLLAMAVAVALPRAVAAPDWQVYYQSARQSVDEIDKDSVHVVDGLVHFRYRNRRRIDDAVDQNDFDRPIEAVADCATRRRADVTKGPLELRAVYEETLSAFQLDFACGLAGVASNKPAAPAEIVHRDWRRHAGGAIDANSVKTRDGLVFFDSDYDGRLTADINSAVVDCSSRKSAAVHGEQFVLQAIDETGIQAPRAKLACELAHLPMTPPIATKAVDFDVVLLDARQAQIDDELYRVDLNSYDVQLIDGLIHFTYEQHFLPDGTMTRLGRKIAAVVDCTGRRRSDDVDGAKHLQPVNPNTRGSRQVDLVCQYASKRFKVGAPDAPAMASFDAPAKATQAATGCRYMRIDGTPVEWRDRRLRVAGTIDGMPVAMMIDTGSTNVVVPRSIASRLRLANNNGAARAYGVGGVTRTALVRTETFSIGSIGRMHLVATVDFDSANEVVLIGNAFLLDYDLELDDHAMNFLQPVDCNGALPIYGDQQTSSTAMDAVNDKNRSLVVQVLVNGRSLRALVDTGAPTTILDLRAARALGVDPEERGAENFTAPGIGTHRMTGWVPQQFERFQIGTETIDKPQFAIADIFGNTRGDVGSSARASLPEAPDMILGADFLHAHRLLFARSRNRMYLSYIGGTVFGMLSPGVTVSRPNAPL